MPTRPRRGPFTPRTGPGQRALRADGAEPRFREAPACRRAPVRAVPAPAAQDTTEIESLYRGLDVARENQTGARVVAVGA